MTLIKPESDILRRNMPDECDMKSCHKKPTKRYDAGGEGPDGFLCNEHDAEIMGKREDNNYGED